MLDVGELCEEAVGFGRHSSLRNDLADRFVRFSCAPLGAGPLKHQVSDPRNPDL